MPNVKVWYEVKYKGMDCPACFETDKEAEAFIAGLYCATNGFLEYSLTKCERLSNYFKQES